MGDYTKVDDPNHPRWAVTCDGMPGAEELEASARRMREQNPLWELPTRVDNARHHKRRGDEDCALDAPVPKIRDRVSQIFTP